MSDSRITQDGTVCTVITGNFLNATPYPGSQTTPANGTFSLWEGNTRIVSDTSYAEGTVVDGYTVSSPRTSPTRLNLQATGTPTIPKYSGAVFIINNTNANGSASWGYVDVIDKDVQVAKGSAAQNVSYGKTDWYGNPGAGGANLLQNGFSVAAMTTPGSGGPFSYQGLTATCNADPPPSGSSIANSATGSLVATASAAIPLGTGYQIVVGIGNGVAVVSPVFDIVPAAAPAPPRNLTTVNIY